MSEGPLYNVPKDRDHEDCQCEVIRAIKQGFFPDVPNILKRRRVYVRILSEGEVVQWQTTGAIAV
jgi:hypothetical protein